MQESDMTKLERLEAKAAKLRAELEKTEAEILKIKRIDAVLEGGIFGLATDPALFPPPTKPPTSAS